MSNYNEIVKLNLGKLANFIFAEMRDFSQKHAPSGRDLGLIAWGAGVFHININSREQRMAAARYIPNVHSEKNLNELKSFQSKLSKKKLLQQKLFKKKFLLQKVFKKNSFRKNCSKKNSFGKNCPKKNSFCKNCSKKNSIGANVGACPPPPNYLMVRVLGHLAIETLLI